MRCPHCSTENRDERATCYHCGRDLTLVRLMHVKAKVHFNKAMELAREGSYYEALGELNSGLDLNSRMAEAHVLRGSILARLERQAEAKEALQAALELNPQAARAHRYLHELDDVLAAAPLVKRLKGVLVGAATVTGLSLLVGLIALSVESSAASQQYRVARGIDAGWSALKVGDLTKAVQVAERHDGGAVDALRAALVVAIQTRAASISQQITAGQHSAAEEEISRLAALGTEGKKEAEKLQAVLRGVRIRDLVARYQTLLEMAEQYATIPVDSHAQWYRQRGELFPADSAAADEFDAAFRPVLTTAQGLYAQVLQAIEDAPQGDAALEREVLRARQLALLIGDQDLLGPVLQRANEKRAATLLEKARAAAAAGDRITLELVGESLAKFDPPITAIDAEVVALRATVEAREREKLLGEVRRTLASDDPQQVLALDARIAASGIVVDDSLRAEIQQARRRHATTNYYLLMQRADEIEGGNLPLEEAASLLQMAEQARGDLPVRLLVRGEENLLWFMVKLHERLGNTEASSATMNELRERHPNSPYLIENAISAAMPE